ncbi:MAG: amino acid adenylation domain-containing protein, partial [Acidobacteriota bacterium]
MSGLVQRLAALPPRRRALLSLRLARLARLRQDAPIPRRTGDAPLSFAQERLWFFDRLESRLGVYNMAYALRVGGADPALLEWSLEEIVRRHEVLRTVFSAGAGGEARVLEAGPRPLPVVDLSALPATAAERERLRRAEGARPFDLARGPLLRTTLVRDGEASELLVNFHHIVADGWSMWVLVGELAALYQGLALPPPPIRYGDFAAWQRDALAGDALAELTAFWKEMLAGLPARLELPADRPRPPVQSFRGGEVPLALAPEVGEAVAALCRGRGATLFMVLLAAFQAVLTRWSGQEEMIVGAVSANRGRSEVEGLIGCFVNTLALPARPAPTFDALLAQVRSSALAGYARQDLPFEKLVDELGVERSLAWSPLVQVMFVLQNTPAEHYLLDGRELRPEEIHSGTSKLDLTLSLTEGSLTGFVEYATDLFDRATVQRLAGWFQELLAAAVALPEAPLDALPMVSDAERHQLLLEWNDTALPRKSALLHELIEAQADRTPDAVAVVGPHGETLTYAGLDRRANALARRLGRLGVGTDTLVGICAERSIEMIVGLLAILKAGAGYVPLDPDYPAERLAYMVEDSAVPVLLAQPHLAGRLPGAVVPLTIEDEAGRSASEALPESAAYAIYTSGSTGRPKGAVNSHRAIVNRLLWMQEAYGLGAADRVLQKTPFSFDVSVWELFWPLMTGARLVFARPGGHREPAYLVERIEAEGVTTLHFVPSMLQVFLEEPDLHRCSSLRQVMASGEALPPDLADRCVRSLGVPLHNLYGPTEAAVDVTFRPCPGGERRVPIGRPIANLRIHLLDRTGRPVPLGTAGELHIGGEGLARGYLHRPALTAERFVPDPLAEAPGERLYRTGDLARHLADGEIEYLGRIDHQVKIRGVRIELGEVEAVLAEHPAVREAVVLARRDALAAFLVLRETAPVDRLRAWVQERLPDAMVPAGWVFLDALPLTPNGKADRSALAGLALDPVPEDATPPRTPLEELLAGLWADLLGRDRAGIHDHFFHLGGHSLLATRLIGRLATRLGLDVPLKAVFAAPTPAALAAWIGQAGAPGLPPIARHTGDPVPSFAQERLWFLDRFLDGEPERAVWNIPFAFRLEGEVDVAFLERSLTRIVERHEVLRAPTGSALPVIDLRGVPPAELDRIVAEEILTPFKLST